MDKTKDMSFLHYRIIKPIPMHPAAYIVDIAYLKTTEKLKPGIALSVVNTYSDCHESYSPDIYFVSNKSLFVEYNPHKHAIVYGKDNIVFSTRDSRPSKNSGGDTVLWSFGTERSSLHTGFSPQGIAFCKLGRILISLWNNEIGDHSRGKVIALSSSFVEVEGFQIFMDKNRPLLLCPTYLKENGNGDICVSDVGAVVVTDAGGMLCFRYRGASRNINFEPYGLCCDSVCNIIIADMKNDRIHVIDKDGGFLHFVRYEGMKKPRALCIDENDNVYVGEWNTTSIKVISR